MCTYFGLSISRSCKLAQIHRSTYIYKPKPNDDDFIISKIYEILEDSLIDGYEMVHMQLRRQGIIINHKRTERLYRVENLQIKARKRRKKVTSEI